MDVLIGNSRETIFKLLDEPLEFPSMKEKTGLANETIRRQLRELERDRKIVRQEIRYANTRGTKQYSYLQVEKATEIKRLCRIGGGFNHRRVYKEICKKCNDYRKCY